MRTASVKEARVLLQERLVRRRNAVCWIVDVRAADAGERRLLVATGRPDVWHDSFSISWLCAHALRLKETHVQTADLIQYGLAIRLV